MLVYTDKKQKQNDCTLSIFWFCHNFSLVLLSTEIGIYVLVFEPSLLKWLRGVRLYVVIPVELERFSKLKDLIWIDCLLSFAVKGRGGTVYFVVFFFLRPGLTM